MGRLRRLAMARQTSIMRVGLVETRRLEEERSKRIAVLEGLLRNYQSWKAILEDSGIDTLLINGEEWNFYDILSGVDQLPPRQQQALRMILIEDRRPVDVAREMFAGSKRIVGEMAVQYKDDALAKLIAWHGQQKEGRR
jgi:hypothetical protein